MASSHMRMRPQLPMFTTSETAPMVQKLVRLATAPKASPRKRPPHATTAAGLVLPTAFLVSERTAILAALVARGIGDAGALETLAPEAARIAPAARAAGSV